MTGLLGFGHSTIPDDTEEEGALAVLALCGLPHVQQQAWCLSGCIVLGPHGVNQVLTLSSSPRLASPLVAKGNDI